MADETVEQPVVEKKKRGRKPIVHFIDKDNDVVLFEFSSKDETDIHQRVGRCVYNKDTKTIRFEGHQEKSAVLFFDLVARYFNLAEKKEFEVITEAEIKS